MFRFPWWITSVSLLVFAVAVKMWQLPLLTDLQLKVFDTYQLLNPRAYVDSPVRIVDIDDESLSRKGQWPWNRTQLAELVAKLQQAGAAVIVFDVVFAEPDRTGPQQVMPLWPVDEALKQKLAALPDPDRVFAQAIAEAPVVGGIVLTANGSELPPSKAGFSFAGQDPSDYVPQFGGGVSNLPSLQQAARGSGVLNSDPDRDGILRRVPLIFRAGGKLYPALSMEALRVAQGARSYVVKSVGASDETEGVSGHRGVTAVRVGRIEVPTDAAGRLWVYYTEPAKSRYVPAWQVLDNAADPALIDGSIVLVGTTAAGLKDLRATPLDPAAGGVEVHAQALEQMLNGIFLSRPDWMTGAEVVFMLVAGGLIMLFISRLNALWAAAFMVSALGGAVAFSWYSFRYERILIEPVTPGAVIMLLYFSETLRRFMRTEQERSRIRNAFSLYMSPALADQLAAHPERLRLGGENREISVMFCDIREFSGISERLHPVELTRFINRFLTPMTEQVLAHEGTIDKYIGDCIMAIWNAPLDNPRHPECAARTALAMRRELVRFNEEVRGETESYGHVPLPVRMGIGINTGECCVGNMGSTVRFEYSALGNEVDMASRLEGLCKLYGVDILLGPNTHFRISGLATLEMDLIRVKGKTAPARIHALLGDEILADDPVFRALAEDHHAMLRAYRAAEWDHAADLLDRCMELAFRIDSLRLSVCYSLYDNRIQHFRENPPSAEWDGVFTALTK